MTRAPARRGTAGNRTAPGLACSTYPPGTQTVGRDAIRELWEKVLANAPHFEQEPPLPTLISGDIALTSTPPKDDAGARAQGDRRQPDGTRLSLLDLPARHSDSGPRRHPRVVGESAGERATFRTGATAADADKRRHRAHFHSAEGWRGRPRAGGPQATGRHLASPARPTRIDQ